MVLYFCRPSGTSFLVTHPLNPPPVRGTFVADAPNGRRNGSRCRRCRAGSQIGDLGFQDKGAHIHVRLCYCRPSAVSRADYHGRIGSSESTETAGCFFANRSPNEIPSPPSPPCPPSPPSPPRSPGSPAYLFLFCNSSAFLRASPTSFADCFSASETSLSPAFSAANLAILFDALSISF